VVHNLTGAEKARRGPVLGGHEVPDAVAVGEDVVAVVDLLRRKRGVNEV
jgi:hypothetical protein